MNNMLLFLTTLALVWNCYHTMTIIDFFPDIKGNLSQITWAHAVNNKSYLDSALNSSVMMLEADVVYGKVNGSGESIPIMGHPPAVTSDLSLETFLTTTYNFNKLPNNTNRKGVKLDFKSTDVFLKSIDLITKLYDSIDYPLWINADIIKGPLVPTTEPVDPDLFLSNAKVFNNSLTVLSLGWTTTTPFVFVKYTDEQINNMADAIQRNNVTQDVTFAVRAGITSRSIQQIISLQTKIPNCTLTVWGSEGDDVDVSALRDVIFDYGVKRVYVDVPQDLLDQLDLENQTLNVQNEINVI